MLRRCRLLGSSDDGRSTPRKNTYQSSCLWIHCIHIQSFVDSLYPHSVGVDTVNPHSVRVNTLNQTREFLKNNNRFVAFLTIITELPDIILVGKTRTWSSNSKWVKRAHKTVEIYYIVRSVCSVRHVRVLPRPII
jgi:hypothetical protein